MIRIIVAGSSDFGLPAFEAIRVDPQLSICGVLSQPDKPVGRKQIVTPTAVTAWAKDHHLDVATPASLKHDAAIAQWLTERRPDLLLVAAYGLLIPKHILRVSQFPPVNIHASLLPNYRGASPIAAAITHGDQVTGISFMQMDEGLDTGPVLRTYSVTIDPTDTRPSLERRLSELAGQHIVAVLTEYAAGHLIAKPQPSTGASIAPRLQRLDGRAIWDNAARLERLVRAYTPWPGVWTTFRGQEFKILAAVAAPDNVAVQPGSVIMVDDAWGIACETGILIPKHVQLAGKKPQSAIDFLHGYAGLVGAVFGV